MAGDLTGCFDLSDHERQVCQLLRSTTRGGNGVLHRVKKRDNLLDFHAESDQLLLGADKRRFAKR